MNENAGTILAYVDGGDLVAVVGGREQVRGADSAELVSQLRALGVEVQTVLVVDDAVTAARMRVQAGAA